MHPDLYVGCRIELCHPPGHRCPDRFRQRIGTQAAVPVMRVEHASGKQQSLSIRNRLAGLQIEHIRVDR